MRRADKRRFQRTISEGGAYLNNERITDGEATVPASALLHGRFLVLRRGKRISPEREALVNLIGMAALLFLMLLVTINDVGNLLHP